jgi:hypothetical protein
LWRGNSVGWGLVSEVFSHTTSRRRAFTLVVFVGKLEIMMKLIRSWFHCVRDEKTEIEILSIKKTLGSNNG